MNIITISREFGSGGRELGKRLADLLSYDYYDKEIIFAIAENRGMDGEYVEKVLSNHRWMNYPLTFRSTLSTPSVNLHIQLLLEQRKVMKEIALFGNNCIFVGRSADVILQEYHPFNVFVCADMHSKVKRCMERADKDEKLTEKELIYKGRRPQALPTRDEKLTEKELIYKIKGIDKSRINTREMIGGGTWGERLNYHLTVNTSGWRIKELAAAVKDYHAAFLGRTK